MALPKITFTIGNGNLGRLGAEIRKTPGFILTGNTVSDGATIGKAYQIFSLQDAIELGITKEGDNAFAYRHIADFYNQTGSGASLWFMLVSDATTLVQMADYAGNIAPVLIGTAQGEIRVLGLVKKSTGSATATDGVDIDTKEAIIKLQELGREICPTQ